jgi:hypothetical protein
MPGPRVLTCAVSFVVLILNGPQLTPEPSMGYFVRMFTEQFSRLTLSDKLVSIVASFPYCLVQAPFCLQLSKALSVFGVRDVRQPTGGAKCLWEPEWLGGHRRHRVHPTGGDWYGSRAPRDDSRTIVSFTLQPVIRLSDSKSDVKRHSSLLCIIFPFVLNAVDYDCIYIQLSVNKKAHAANDKVE